MDKFTRIGLLYEFYGALLSRRQREVTALYYDDNLSLAEIAAEFAITRQGVYDALHSGEQALEKYENKLGLFARFQKRNEAAEKAYGQLAEIIKKIEEEGPLDAQALSTDLKAISQAVDALKEE